MKKLTDKQINAISQELQCGFICNIHKETMENVLLPDFNMRDYAEEGDWEEAIQEVEGNPESYISIEPMDSRESFGVMEDFALYEVPEGKLKERLIRALERKGPFQNFKWEIDNSGEYRQKWFDYRDQRYNEFVRQQLEFRYDEEDQEEVD
jgi:hypothetical protein